MNPAEFDLFADAYEQQHACNIRLSGETPAYFSRYKVQDVVKLCTQQPTRILDFGAGVGTSIPHWNEAFPQARLTCLDVSQRSLAIANARHPDTADYCIFDGSRLPFASDSFDVAFAACVFHHIAAEHHTPLLSELHRILCKGGQLFVFEHNPLNPLTRHAVNTCPFDANAELILAHTMRDRLRDAGFAQLSLAYRIFFPGALSMLRPLERMLTHLPLGAQYRLQAQK